MSLSRRMNLSGKEDSSFSCGLINDYESRRPKTRRISSDISCPRRTCSDFSSVDYDESYMSRRTASPSSSNLLSPRRQLVDTPLRSSPSYYPKRFTADSFNETSSLVSGLDASPSFGNLSGRGRTAHDMGVDDFPLVCSTVPVIPLLPVADTPRPNRVRVRICPTIDLSETGGVGEELSSCGGEEMSTVKSVIQALKDMSRKRAYIPEEDEESREVKRRAEQNIYLSQGPNQREERKRGREADWEAAAGPKRHRPNSTHNNEIFSSLSSSIHLRQALLKPAHEKPPEKISIGTQVTPPEDSPEVQPEKDNKTKKEVRDAATMPDPPPRLPTVRPPVEEKIVTDPNIILKSALSKFKILPRENTNDVSSSVSFTPPTRSGPVQAALSSSPSLTSTSLTSTPSLVSPVVSSTAFNAATSTTGKSSEHTEQRTNTSRAEEVSSKVDPKPDFSGFKLVSSTSDANKSEQLFKFGTPLVPPTNQVPIAPELSIVSTTHSFSAPSLTFSSPSNQIATISSPFKMTSTSSPVMSVAASPSMALQPSSHESNTQSPSPAIQPFKFGAAVVKTNETTVEKRDTNSTSLFSFGKNESKIPSDSTKDASAKPSEENAVKPFQFGGGSNVINFGQTANKSTNDAPNNSTLATTSSSAGESSKSIFSFGGTDKKVEKSGGFAFKFPSASNESSEKKPLFGFTTVSSSAPATCSSGSTTNSTSKPTAPIFPSSLFGSSTSTTAANVSLSTLSSATPTSVSLVSTTNSSTTSNLFKSTFGTPSTTSAIPNFGSVSTSVNAPLFTTATVSASSVFGSTSQTPTTSIFGSGLSSGTTTSTLPAMTSTTAPALSTPVFGNTSTFGKLGAATITTTTVFGNSASTTAFGNSTPAITQSVFGSSSATPAFGRAKTTAPSTFSSPPVSTPAFGSAGSSVTGFRNPVSSTPNTTPVFGTSTPVFGTTAAASGSSTFTGANNNVFGSSSTTTPSFGSTASGTTPAFGTTALGSNAPLFGTGSATTAFGANSNASSFGTNNAPSFGSQSQGFGGQTASAFGSAPTFASSSTFGAPNTTPAFSSTPSFASSSTAPAFGSASAAPAFGNANPATPAPAFGSATPATPTPAFGSSTPATPAPAFGSSTPATPAPAFGTSATPAFGSSAPTGFGVSNFGNQDANKPFSFTASAAQSTTQSSGVFNFSGAQQTQSTGGLFQFGASAQSSNQPFQFSAPQPAPGGGQQMFSIGSGSTAPRRITTRRKK